MVERTRSEEAVIISSQTSVIETQVIEVFPINAVDQQGIAGCGSARPGFGCGLIDGHEAQFCRHVILRESTSIVIFPAGDLVGGGYDGSGSRLRHDGLHLAALVVGEGEGGLGAEVGRQVDGGRHVDGAVNGVVAVHKLFAEGGEVVDAVGRGHDGDVGAVVDAVLVLSLGGGHAGEAVSGGVVEFETFIIGVGDVIADVAYGDVELLLHAVLE